MVITFDGGALEASFESGIICGQSYGIDSCCIHELDEAGPTSPSTPTRKATSLAYKVAARGSCMKGLDMFDKGRLAETFG